MEADRTVAIYSLPRLLGAAARLLRRRRRVLAQRAARPPVRGRPAAHRRRRRRAELAVGARAALHDRQHALRGRPGAAADHEPRPRGARRSRSASARSRGIYEICGDPLPLCGDDHRTATADAGRRADGRRGRVLGRRGPVAATGGSAPRLNPAMAGIVIVGAQWGDEGKGKITDLFAEHADLVIRFQGGNNAGHTIVRDGVTVEVPPDPVRDPLSRAHVRDRQRRGDRPEGAHRRARRAARQGRRPLRPAHQRQRAPDHAVPHAPRPRGRGEARQAADRHDAARHRPLLRRQGGAARHPRPGPARREDPQEEDRRRDGPQAALPAPLRQGPGARPAVDDRGLPHLRPPDRAVHRRHRAPHLGGARQRRHRASSRAPRARCWTSTTARIRS